MIVAGVLGLLFVVIVGCGTKPQPETADVEIKSDSASIPNSNTTSESKPEPVKLVHEMDPAKHIVPSAMVTGSAGGIAFKPEASIEGDELIFQTMKMGTSVPDREIRLKLESPANPHAFESRKLTIRQDMPVGHEVPEILVSSPNGKLNLYPNGYALTLELGVRQDWKVPGKIYLCIPDEEKTILAGVFIASYPRQPAEAPGPDDLPYIKGSVTVIGAAQNTLLRVGFVASNWEMGSVNVELCEPVNPIRWQRTKAGFKLTDQSLANLKSENVPESMLAKLDPLKNKEFSLDDLGMGISKLLNVDETRLFQSLILHHARTPMTTLIAGDGKNVPSRYELSRLPTGRYLVFATLEPAGPTAWKWVTVIPGEAHTVDLTINTTQTGGVEVGVPLEAVKNVQMVPADNPDIHMLERTLFDICNMELGRFGLEKPIIARKALYKNLTPGRYEVRAGGQTRIVEIIAGKTVELDFEKAEVIPTKQEHAPEPRPKG
jgi:hypothetical protein